MHWLLSSTLLLTSAAPPMEPGPKSPEESLKCIQVRPGFKVELMAAEPLVQDPIAFAWGPDGKFWVVEMGDYPLGAGGKDKPGGRVKFLTKSKENDGPYDTATLFLDNLGYPTGVLPYGKGVLVTCAPDIFYAEDTDGDGKADKKEILYTGFREGNQQHRVNGLVWGLDNWIYGANGDSGGIVQSLKTGQSVNISGRDFRIRPWSGEIEAQTGQSQFGRCRDDWGNWFGCNNSNPMYHFVLDDHYLRRNPHVLYPDPKVQVSVTPGAAPVYPISKPLPRFNNPHSVNHFTSACSAIVYRDNLFGPEFANNTFVSEPVHNLIHREIMKPKGVTFTSQRADDEKTSEFLASSDNWFRPTMLQTGPDGALWVADMYRYVIEHPEWIPKDWQEKLDLRAGHDMGRIYRIYPADKTPYPIPRLDRMRIPDLVDRLQSPNGWTRDMAQRQLIASARRGSEWTNFDYGIGQLALQSKTPQGRIHALYTLASITDLASPAWTCRDHVAHALRDSHPAVRRHGVRLWEQYGDSARARAALTPLLNDEDPQVRMQLAYSLGMLHGPTDAVLVKLLCREKDRYIAAAALSSLVQTNWTGVFNALQHEDEASPGVLAALLPIAKAYGQPNDVLRMMAERVLGDKGPAGARHFETLADTLDSLQRSRLKDETLMRLPRIEEIFSAARKQLSDSSAGVTARTQAARLLGRGLGNDREDMKLLASLLTPRTPDDVQAAAIQGLARSSDPRVPDQLMKPWSALSPGLRVQVLDALLGNVIWTRMLIDALERKQFPASEIDAVRRQRLLGHRDEGIRQSATKLFAAGSDPDRTAIVMDYVLKLPEKSDVGRGAKLFTKTCAACHKLGDVGQAVGPDLASVGDKSAQGLLTAMLDPNRAVEARYVNYLATTKGGLTLSGMLQSETSTTITLVSSDGKSHQLLRNELDELVSTGKSLMPEGLERDLTPQDMADIIAFVTAGLRK